jgi:hypothetical protein
MFSNILSCMPLYLMLLFLSAACTVSYDSVGMTKELNLANLCKPSNNLHLPKSTSIYPCHLLHLTSPNHTDFNYPNVNSRQIFQWTLLLTSHFIPHRNLISFQNVFQLVFARHLTLSFIYRTDDFFFRHLSGRGKEFFMVYKILARRRTNGHVIELLRRWKIYKSH